jgi:thiazole/oxazole-forming peptide maturase SagC family component
MDEGISSMEKPRIKRGYITIVPNPDEVHIRTGFWSPAFVIRDDKETGKLSRFISLLDGAHTVDAIIDALGRDMEEEIRELIIDLEWKGVIEDATAEEIAILQGETTPEEIEKYQPALSYFKLASSTPSFVRVPTAESILVALKNAKVLLIGARMLGSRLALQLAQLGVRNISLVDDQRLSKQDLYFAPFLAPQKLDMSCAEATMFMVEKVNPQATVQVLKNQELKEALQNKNYNLIIVAKDRPHPALYDEINKHVLEKKVTWTIVTMDGLAGIVGPTIVPFETACYKCYELRLESNIKEYSQYLQYKKYLNDNPSEYGKSVGLPSFADVVTGFLSSDVPSILLNSGATFGKMIYFHFPTLRMEVNNVLKLARCPACGKGARGKPTYQLYRTIASLLEDRGLGK